MELYFNTICGFMFGFEFVQDEEVSCFVLDLFIIRIMICKENNGDK